MSDNGLRFRSFVAELRRRRVFRVVVVYAIATFGVLQVADIAFPALKLPEWSVTLIVAVALLGFPVALVLAWAFDITPRGVIRTEPLAETGSRFQRHGRVLALASAGLVTILTIAVGWYVLPKLPGWWGDTSIAAASEPAKPKLVVLPFENLGSPVDEYFADGVTEEITARLATTGHLGVIARTSAIRYKGTDKSVPQIGEELGVDYILEGTVRWESQPDGQSRVRVTPQLIKVSDATHLWAEIYEEPISSVFEVQSEIAEKVVEALGVTLRERERLALRAEPTRNLEAYNLYLLGNEYLSSSSSPTSAQEALELLERAVALDPGFDLAQRKLAEAHANLYWANFKTRFGVRTIEPGMVLERLRPGSFGADTASYLLARALLLRRAERGSEAQAHFDSARVVLEDRVAASPAASRLHAQLGLAYAGLGLRDEAIREGQLAVEQLSIADDPYAGAALVDNLAHIYVIVGEHDAAIEALESLLTTDSPVTRAWLMADPTWDPLRSNPKFQELVEGDR
jgi:TolB-like protein